MQSSAIESPSTSKFQYNLPLALQQISPSLAALHATRARLLHLPSNPPDVLAATHCTRCGTYLLDGMGSVRTVRKTKRVVCKGDKRPAVSFSRKLRRVCNVCKHEEDIPIDNGSAQLFPRVRRKGADTKSVLAPIKGRSSPALLQRDPVKSQPASIKGSAASSRASSVASAHQTPRIASPAPVVPNQLSSTPSSSNTGTARMKTRAKKKSGLQEMLARNRERQEQEKKAGASGGLAAFLESL